MYGYQQSIDTVIVKFVNYRVVVGVLTSLSIANMAVNEWFSSARKFIFGYDIFISYSRKDSLDYAYSIAKHFMKKEYGFECYIDQLSSTTPGKALPGNILSALAKSTAFIIIGSEGARHSAAITEEVRNFKLLKTNNPIIPINITGNLFLADWYNQVEGLAVINESVDSFVSKQASADILERIHNSLNFTKKSQKLRRAAFAFLFFFLLSALATIVIFNQAGKAKTELKQTLTKIRYEKMNALLYSSRISSDTNSIIALKYALKACLEYQDIDTAHIAEKHLLDLYNNHAIIIKNNFMTGGQLSPGGKFILTSNVLNLATKKEVSSGTQNDMRFAEDDNIAVTINEKQATVFRLSDGAKLIFSTAGDSSIYSNFTKNGNYIFLTSSDYDHENQRVRVLDAAKFKMISDFKIPSQYNPEDLFADPDGLHILMSVQDGAKNIYSIYHEKSGKSEKLLPDDPALTLNNYSLTGKGHLLQFSVRTSELKGGNSLGGNTLKGTKYIFNLKLVDGKGLIQQDSTYEHDDFFGQKTPPESLVYRTGYGDLFAFGIYGAFGQKNFLVNTASNPLAAANRFRLGFGFPINYEFIKLLSSQYLIAVSMTDNKYRFDVFNITRSFAEPVLTTFNENHPNGSVMDDRFMKSINISYSPSSNFLTVYDRGLGVCTMHYLEKKPVSSAKQLVSLLSGGKMFGEIWKETVINAN